MLHLGLKTKSKPTKVMFIGAHSDDIEIGCGGTILSLLESAQIPVVTTHKEIVHKSISAVTLDDIYKQALIDYAMYKIYSGDDDVMEGGVQHRSKIYFEAYNNNSIFYLG